MRHARLQLVGAQGLAHHAARVDVAGSASDVGGERNRKRLPTRHVDGVHDRAVEARGPAQVAGHGRHSVARRMLDARRVDHRQCHEASRVAQRKADGAAGRAIVHLGGLPCADAVADRGLGRPSRGAARHRFGALRCELERVQAVGRDGTFGGELALGVGVDLLAGAQRHRGLAADLDGSVEDLDLVAAVRAHQDLELGASDLGADGTLALRGPDPAARLSLPCRDRRLCGVFCGACGRFICR